MTNSFEALNNQAIELAANGDYTEAIACFHAAMRQNQNNHLLWYNLGVTYRDAGNTEAARDAMTTAYGLAPLDEDILENLSVICYQTGDIGLAFRYADEALALNKDNAHIWNNKGVFWFSQQQYANAARAFETALAIYPHYTDALINLRDTYEELHNDIGREECITRLRQLHHKGYTNA